jgi:hypothetical protein
MQVNRVNTRMNTAKSLLSFSRFTANTGGAVLISCASTRVNGQRSFYNFIGLRCAFEVAVQC